MKATCDHPMTTSETENLSIKIGANKYLECSALTKEGVDEVFESATRLAVTSSDSINARNSLREWLSRLWKGSSQ
ncbi:hypothetical protein F4809DRAFT_316338 [Biscogniauxia mediterranea]|nr:hypothetical protein F4809DRAFT_316338 [Biscogniauxia mediterranea]